MATSVASCQLPSKTFYSSVWHFILWKDGLIAHYPLHTSKQRLCDQLKWLCVCVCACVRACVRNNKW